MFAANDYAFVHHSFDLRGKHFPGQEPVFRIIFEVSARVKRTVNVSARRVNHRVADMHGFMRVSVAEFLHQIYVEACRGKNGGRESVISGVHALRTVCRLNARCAYAFRAGKIRHAVVHHVNLLFLRHLVEQFFPKRVVVAKPFEHGYVERALRRSNRAVNGHFVALFNGYFVSVLHVVNHSVAFAFELNAFCRIRAVPVASRNVFYLLVGSAFVKVKVCVVESVGYFDALFVFGIRFEVVLGNRYFIRHVRVARGVHSAVGVGGGITLCRKHVVERVMRGSAYRKIIIAFFEYVSLCAVRIVRA